MSNSIYSRGPISKMSKTVARIKLTVAGTKTCAQRCFYEIKVPIPYNHAYFCFTKRTLEEEKYSIFRFYTIINIMWPLPRDG